MKQFLLAIVVLIPSIAFSATHTVQMKSISYDPKIMQVKAGDSVEWRNVSYTEHSATSDEGAAEATKFESGLVAPKKTSKKIEFKNPGTYTYHCSVHGKTMSGKIEVQ